MGIFEFIREGVAQLVIARPDTARDQLVFKHVEDKLPFWSQLSVDADDVCLFFRETRYVGSLGPGRHMLQADNIPFLDELVEHGTGRRSFTTELFFVSTRPRYNQPFADTIGSMRDPEFDLRVTPRARGAFSFRISDPRRFVGEFLGRSGVSDAEQVLHWVQEQLFVGLRTTLAHLVAVGDLTFMDLGGAGPDVARAIVANCPVLTGIGVQVLEVAKLDLSLSEDDERNVHALQDQIVEAKVRARVARSGHAADTRRGEKKAALDQAPGRFADRAVACARCCSKNPPTARFCAECGSRMC